MLKIISCYPYRPEKYLHVFGADSGDGDDTIYVLHPSNSYPRWTPAYDMWTPSPERPIVHGAGVGVSKEKRDYLEAIWGKLEFCAMENQEYPKGCRLFCRLDILRAEDFSLEKHGIGPRDNYTILPWGELLSLGHVHDNPEVRFGIHLQMKVFRGIPEWVNLITP